MKRKPKLFRGLKPILLSVALLPATATQAGDWGVNVFGLSYHWDRALAKKN